MIEVRGVVKHLGSRKDRKRVIQDLSFAAPPGLVAGFLGPNGAGKTTTMRILATLLKPDEGKATVGGHDITEDPLGFAPPVNRPHGSSAST